MRIGFPVKVATRNCTLARFAWADVVSELPSDILILYVKSERSDG